MSQIGKITRKTENPYLNFYEIEAIHRDGQVSPYYMASRAREVDQLKAVTGTNPPDGVILYGIYGENRDHLVLLRQYRYALGDYVYELPAGLVDPGESMVQAGIREMYEETGLEFSPLEGGACSRPFFTSIGLTDESCAALFGYCSGQPTSRHQESAEDIEVVLADRAQCRRILRDEKVALMCAYLMMHFISNEDPMYFLTAAQPEGGN